MIQARMDELGIIPAELARRLRTSSAQISLLFKHHRSSGMVPRVHKVLRLPPPVLAGVDAEVDALKAEIDDNWKYLTEDERELMVRMTRVAVKQRNK